MKSNDKTKAVSAEIVKQEEAFLSPDSIRDPEVLAGLMKEPYARIAEVVTGALAMGRPEITLAVGRIVQAALKAKTLEQVGREIKELQEKGRIKEDYAKTKHGFKSLAELLEFIDSDPPDEDRLSAVKAMFWGVNRVDAREGDRVLNYQLFQISKRLSASQLLVLRVCNNIRQGDNDGRPLSSGLTEWAQRVAQKIGHNIAALVLRDEPLLIQEGLISDRVAADRSGINARDARLTDLGIAFCDRIIQYEQMRSSDQTPPPESGGG